MPARSMTRPITPSSASISRTRWPLPSPPIAGLQDISPIVSSRWVSSSVRAPSRADAAAASQPAWPPPTTITSYAKADMAGLLRQEKEAEQGSAKGGRYGRPDAFKKGNKRKITDVGHRVRDDNFGWAQSVRPKAGVFPKRAGFKRRIFPNRTGPIVKLLIRLASLSSGV